MMKIGLLSDTHSFLNQGIFKHFAKCDEIWHAGDFGDIKLIEELSSFKPLRGVFGNIDDKLIRAEFPEDLVFYCEEVKVFMTHIGGYPGKYVPRVKKALLHEKPQLFISGHSHILKVMYDQQLQCLHLNPGAAGNQGWHKIPTLMRFEINGAKIENLEVIELHKPAGIVNTQ